MSDRNRPIKVLIIGAAGMIGRKLTARLLADGRIGSHALDELVLADIVMPEKPSSPTAITTIASDLSRPGAAAALVQYRPDLIFHLAAIVSGEAEADFDKGYRINLDGTRLLFEAIRKAGRPEKPRLVFTSSIAVFGAPFPELIGDDFLTAPLTSYGTQKAICELLLSDYTRRGFFDGIGIRLPTICVRPVCPTRRRPASSPASSANRWSARRRCCRSTKPSATAMRARAPPLPSSSMPQPSISTASAPGAILSMPGLSVTVGEQIEALRRVAGDAAVRRIRHEPDPVVERIVAGWPRSFAGGRAQALGFAAETSFDDIVRIHIEDELGGRLP